MKITKTQSKDTGIVAGLVLIAAGLYTGDLLWIKISFGVLLAAVILPGLYHFPAVLWYGLSELTGGIVSKIVLGIIYLLVVLPVSVIRKLSGKDSMMLASFGKKDMKSSWTVREHQYAENDIVKPF